MPDITMPRPSRNRQLGAILAIAAGYWLSGQLGLLLAIPPGFATSIWPPAGIALAGLLLAGVRAWPGVFLGSLLINLAVAAQGDAGISAQALAVAGGIATGATLQAIVGAWLIRRRIGWPSRLDKEEDIFHLVAIGSLSCLINAAIGPLVLRAAGLIATLELAGTAGTWWIGDLIGVLVFAPLLIVLLLPRTQISIRRKISIALPLLLLMGLVIGTFSYAKTVEQQSVKRDVERKLDDRQQALESSLDKLAMYMHAIDTFYQSSDFVSRGEFHTFVKYIMADHENVVALGWAPHILAGERSSYEDLARIDGVKDFEIKQQGPDHKPVRADERAEYYPSYYIESYEPSTNLGFDLASDPVRRGLLNEAILRNTLIVSPRIHLIKDPDGAYAILFYQPIFKKTRPLDTLVERRDAIQGFAIAAIRVSATIKAALGDLVRDGIRIKVEDLNAPAEQKLLFDSAGDAPPPTGDLINATATVKIGERTWLLTASALPSLLAETGWTLWFVLIGGAAFTGLLGALLLIVTGRNEVVMRLVDSRTEELRQSEERFELASSGANVGIWDMDLATDRMYASPTLLKLFGIRNASTDIIAEVIRDRMHPDDQAGVAAARAQHLRAPDSPPFVTEYRIRRDDGTYVWIQANGKASWHKGTPQRMSGTAINITERKSFEEALRHTSDALTNANEFFTLMMSSIPDLVFVKDEQLRIVQGNPPFLNLFSEDTGGSALGSATINSYSKAETLAILASDREAFATGTSEVVETVQLPKVGQRHLFTKRVRFLNTAGERFILGISRDITDMRRSEAQRLLLMDKLTESNTELERFAYVASHDMQEPLRMIANFSHLIVTEYSDRLDADGQVYLNMISGAALRMQAMVADLLEYARVGSDASRFTQVNADKEFVHMLDNLLETIKEHQASVTSDPLPTFTGNPVQFMRLLQNLVGNGLKYQAPGNQPKIHISAADAGDVWRFDVRDNGIGMQAKHTQQIFEPFKRLHSWQQYQGTGIGLAVCKKIVENHGGTISATSEVGTGSVFSFTIPKLARELP